MAEVSAGGNQAAVESSENATSKSDESTPAKIKRAPKRKSEQLEEEHADDDAEGKSTFFVYCVPKTFSIQYKPVFQ